MKLIPLLSLSVTWFLYARCKVDNNRGGIETGNPGTLKPEQDDVTIIDIDKGFNDLPSITANAHEQADGNADTQTDTEPPSLTNAHREQQTEVNADTREDSDKLPLRGHMKKLGEQSDIVENELTVLDYMIGGQDFYEHFIRKRTPVVFKSIAKDWNAVKHWKNESYLLEKYADVLIDVEMGKVYETSQHPRVTMTMREFLSKYRDANKMYLDSPFPQSNMTADMEVPLMMQCDKLYTRFTSAHILFSNGGTSCPLHYDGYENFLTMMSGYKVVLIAHYKYANDLYIDSYHDFPGLSPVNPERVDLVKYPRVADVLFHKVVLRPGDMLYIPEGWFHQVRSYESPNIAVSMWFHMFEGEYSDINNNTLRLDELAQYVAKAPNTITCINQVVNLFSYPAINLSNIRDQPVGPDFVNRTVLYDLVSTTDAVIYVGSDDHWIYAIDMKTGTVKWKVETKEDTGSTCAFNPGETMVYCGADDHYMRAMHVSNGSIEWCYKTGDRVISSAIVDNKTGYLYFGSLDYNIYALNPNGTLRWKTGLFGSVWSTPVIDFKKGVIYIATDNVNAEFNLYALEQDTGTIIWRKYSSFAFLATPRLSLATGELYIADKGGNVFMIDAESGRIIHRFDMNDTSGIMSSPTFHRENGLLYSIANSGLLIAYDMNSKDIKWELNLGKSDRGSNSSPYIGRDGILYVGAGNGTVFKIHPLKGTIKWSTDIGTGIFFSSPRLDKNGVLYIGSMDGPLFALDSTKGSVIWKAKTNGPLVGTALITRAFY